MIPVVILYEHFITRLVVSGTRSSLPSSNLYLFLLSPLNELLMVHEALD